MHHQNKVYVFLVATLVFIFVGMSLINGWVNKQISMMSDDGKSETATRTIPPSVPMTSSPNPDLNLIGTPLDPLAPMPRVSHAERPVVENSSATYLPSIKTDVLTQ